MSEKKKPSAKRTALDKSLRPATYADVLPRIRDRISDLESRIFQELLSIADLLIEAKNLYEAETGSGQGKKPGLASFAETAAVDLGCSESFIRRFCRIGQLDAKSRSLIHTVPNLRTNQDALLALVQESDPERRWKAIEAFETEGRQGLNRVLTDERLYEKASKDPHFLSLVIDMAGGDREEDPEPADILTHAPTPEEGLPPKPRSTKAFGDGGGIGLVGFEVELGKKEQIKLNGLKLTLTVFAVSVRRSVLEKALQSERLSLLDTSIVLPEAKIMFRLVRGD